MNRKAPEAGRGKWTLGWLCLGIMMLLGGSGRVQAFPAPAAAPQLTIHSVKFTGAKTIPIKRLKEELLTPIPSPWPWKKAPVFKPEDLESDAERLKWLYRGQGFYHAHITPQIVTKDGQVDITLNIEEGPWVQVTGIAVQVVPATPPPDLSGLTEKWPVQMGDRFQETTYDAVKRVYLDYLLDHGYPKGKVEGKVLLDEEKNTARINLTVTPGPLYYFGEARVSGEPETPARVILRRLTFKKGDLFSFKELYDTLQRLYTLDLFSSVELIPEEAAAKDHRIPIIVSVKEKKKRSLKVGVGYGDEDEFRARLALRFRNLAGGGRMLDLDTKLSRLEYRAEGTFVNPLVLGSNWDLIFQSGFIRRYLPVFTDRAYFVTTRLERELPWHFRGFCGYGLEFARPFNVPEETLLLLTQTEVGKLYTASMLQGGVRQETTDNPVDPHRGGLFLINGEVAPNFFGSNLQFVRGVVEARRYYSLFGSDFILAGRLRFGAIVPMQDTTEIPIFRRFFAGGFDTVRGYRFDYLGPRTWGGIPVGGESLIVGNLELRIPIYKEFRAVTFLDFGNVFLKVGDTDVGQLKYASGLGLRYQTFIGALGVDIGFPLNPINSKVDRYHINFTVGQAF
jgi:outer membrane protein insertion porin family